MYTEDDFIQLSALQHYVFCHRQCALIHIEQVWIENLFTAEGRIMHDKAHEERIENRKDLRIERGMFLRSFELGLIGKADVVEFHRDTSGSAWTPFPVEYKRGKPKTNNCDKVQLCAQALCLEEMMGARIEEGALFYGKTRHRHTVVFDKEIRKITKDAAGQLHAFIEKGETPRATYGLKCKTCSLLSVCMPKTLGRRESVARYLDKQLKEP